MYIRLIQDAEFQGKQTNKEKPYSQDSQSLVPQTACYITEHLRGGVN